MRCGWPRRPSLRRVRSTAARLDELADTLARDGLIRVDELLPPDLCSELAAHADSAIAAAQDSVREGTARPTDHFAEHLLHGPQCGKRHDSYLPTISDFTPLTTPGGREISTSWEITILATFD